MYHYVHCIWEMSSDRIFIDMVLIIKSKRVFNELIFMLHLDEGRLFN